MMLRLTAAKPQAVPLGVIIGAIAIIGAINTIVKVDATGKDSTLSPTS